MKADVKKKLNLMLIIVLSALALGFLILAIFYHSKLVNRVYNTNLGDSLLLEVDATGVALANISYPNNLVNGLEYKQKVNIIGTENTVKSFVRAKAVFADYNNVREPADVEITKTENWLYNETDGYFYLNKFLKKDVSFEFIEKIVIPRLAPRVKNNAVLTIVVESADFSKNVLSFWDAPQEWYENIA